MIFVEQSSIEYSIHSGTVPQLVPAAHVEGAGRAKLGEKGGSMRLNGWQRIGIVASVVWAIGAAFMVRSEQSDRAIELYSSRHYLCSSEAAPERAQQCRDGVLLEEVMDMTANWPDVAFVAFAPVAAAWLMAWLSLRVFRWIRAGFNQ
jgi:hypothetical protein